MRIYIRKLFAHDISHEISITKEVVKDFFENQTSLPFYGKKSGFTGTVAINSATDPRFGGAIKNIIDNEGGVVVDDLLLIEKKGEKYCLDIIKKDDGRYDVISNLYDASDRHIIGEVDGGLFVKADESDSDFLTHSVYGIHIKKENDALSSANPHICIGWSDLGDLSSVSLKKDISELYQKIWPSKKVKSKAQDVGQIYRFVLEAKENDYVVFGDGMTAHIGIIKSGYYYDASPANQDLDYVNNRKVDWLLHVSYTDLSKEFRNSLGCSMSFFKLNDYRSVIYDLLNNSYDKNQDDIGELSEENIFDYFQQWLTTKDNPEYTGKEQYPNYANYLKKLVDFMQGENIIDDNNLNELNVDKYYYFLNKYEESDDAKEYDKKNLSNCTGRAALKKYILYIKYLLKLNYSYDDSAEGGKNLVIFGTPGCGKSFYVDHDILGRDNAGMYSGDYREENIIRTTFFQDYSNTDFVGQVMPVIKTEKKDDGSDEQVVTYMFVPGPFSLALECAIAQPQEKVALVIEELNRGNAPSIFGDLFQLLDRVSEPGKGYPIGTSEYGITNVNIINYLSDNTHYEKKYKYSFNQSEIRIPSNLYIYATMNTSDQNVFTLDTAFKRRWEFKKLKNEFTSAHVYANFFVPGMNKITWKHLVDDINDYIISDPDAIAAEDKQIGVYFVTKDVLCEKEADCGDQDKKEKLAYKLFEYLWDDVAKFSRPNWFGDIKSLDKLIEKYMASGEAVFKNGIIK